jgi:hypothetical protein
MSFWFTGADKTLNDSELYGYVLDFSDPFILAVILLQPMFVANSKWESITEVSVEHCTQYQNHTHGSLTLHTRKVYGVEILQLVHLALLQSALHCW